MKDNQKFTIGLVAAAVVLGGYMYFIESKKEVRPDSKDVVVWSLSEGQASDLKRLVVTTEGKTATYTRTGDVWKLTEQPTREIDTTNFKSPYDKLREMVATRKVEDKLTDAAKYGLDKPTATIVWGEANTPYKMEFGADTPTGDAVFAHTAKDDGVYTIAKYRLDEWKGLAKNPPLLPLPTPTPAPTAAPSAAAASAAPGAQATPATAFTARPTAAPATARPVAPVTMKPIVPVVPSQKPTIRPTQMPTTSPATPVPAATPAPVGSP